MISDHPRALVRRPGISAQGCGPSGPDRGTWRGSMAGMRPDDQALPTRPQRDIRDLQGVGDAERAGAMNTDTGLDAVGARQGITRPGTSPGGGSTGVDSGGGGGSLGGSGGNLM